jgi:MFS family permease
MIESPVRIVRRLPQPVQLLVLGSFINKVGTFILPYLALVLRREFALSPRQVALILSSYGVGTLVSILLGGILTDRLGRRRTLLTSLLGSGVLAVAIAAAPSLPVFVTLLMALGFLADLYRPAASALIGDALPSAQRAVGFGALRMAVNLGFACGMALGGMVADWSWRALFLGDGLTTLLFGMLVYFYIPEPPRVKSGSTPGAPVESPWRDPVFLQVAAVAFTFSLVFFTFVTVLPVTVTMAAGYPARTYGALIAVNGLLIALLEVSATQALGGFRRLRVASLGLLLGGLGFGLSGLILHWSWFLFTVLVWTAGEILVSPQQQAFVADWAPPASRGRYMSLFQASWSLAFVANPLLLVPLHARLGDAAFWPLMPLITVPGALLLLRLDRVADRPPLLRGASGRGPAAPARAPAGV